MDLSGLAKAIDHLVSADPSTSATGEELVQLDQLRSRLDALFARAAAGFEAGEGYVADGARNAVAWLATRTRRPMREVRAELRVGRALRELPAFEEAFSRGAIASSHVLLVSALLGERTRAALHEGESILCEQACQLRFSAFERAVGYFTQLADQDGTDVAAEERRARRDASLVQSFDGTWFGKVTLDPIAGSIVDAELTRISAHLLEADRAEAAARLGRPPHPHELARTPAQRRADALVEMARRSTACPDDTCLPGVLVSVLVDFPTISGRVCELSNGKVISPGSLLPYLDKVVVERAVWKGRDRVEIGARSRLFTGATRRAVELRDRACQHPYCEIPADRCQVDHIIPASRRGPTTQENGRLLCRFHNLLRNRRPELPELPPPPWPQSSDGP